MASLTRPLFRWLGGKWQLAPWIMSFFPPHQIYCEPFAGGASVLLRKPPSSLEIYNDLDSRVVTFFRLLRNHPADLIRQIQLTPFSREEHTTAMSDCDDELEQSRRLYVRSWQSRGAGVVNANTGWRYQNKDWGGVDVVDSWNRLEDLWLFVQRLRQVQIENAPAIDVIKRFDSPSTLLYVDPPYLPSTRSRNWRHNGYRFELSYEEHRELASVLHSIKGMAIISGYPSELYDELYKGWYRVEKTCKTNGNTQAIECLWISHQCQEARLPLFASARRSDLRVSADQSKA